MVSPDTPPHTVTRDANREDIQIMGWKIAVLKYPISNASELEEMREQLHGLPLPEMTFGANSLAVHHIDSGWCFEFNALEALRLVRNGELQLGDGGIKVGYSEEWLKSRCAHTAF